jgi:hypothetical protein
MQTRHLRQAPIGLISDNPEQLLDAIAADPCDDPLPVALRAYGA